MKFYLSSYKLGNETDKLKELIRQGNKKVAYIPNALDFSLDVERRAQSEQTDIEDLQSLGLDVDRIDLRNFFSNKEELKEKLNLYDVFWVRGGNVFVLRQAMSLSGFDYILKNLTHKNIIYGGYSAGVCVLSPTLKGFGLMDDPSQKPYGNDIETIWDGLGLIDFSIVPHFQSDHRESDDANKVVEYLTTEKISFKAIKDGEVIIIE